MAGLNKVMLVGNLGRDPEIRYTQNGVAVANFTMATSETWKDKNTGEKKSDTEWHRIVFWGKQAEVIGEYLQKGRQILVEGKLKTRKWTDQQNVDRYITEIHGSSFLMLGNRSDNGGGGQRQPQGGQQQGGQPQGQGGFQNPQQNPTGGQFNGQQGGGAQYPGNEYSGGGGVPGMDDDIPF